MEADKETPLNVTYFNIPEIMSKTLLKSSNKYHKKLKKNGKI